MEAFVQVRAPLTRESARALKAGDRAELSGVLYTARDAAHQRIARAAAEGKAPPFDLAGQVIFYAGPCPAKPGHAAGSIAATTSLRMDGFVEALFRLGMLGMVGKGERSPFVAKLCKEYGGVYFLSVGGASALISRQVLRCEAVAYEDLGTESVKRLEVERLRLVVGIDAAGRVFQDEQLRKYRRSAVAERQSSLRELCI